MAYGKTDNYSKFTEELSAFMCPEVDRNGNPYWTGYVDLGAGKGIKLTMFNSPDTNKSGKKLKSDFVVKVNKKSYDQNKTKRSSW